MSTVAAAGSGTYDQPILISTLVPATVQCSSMVATVATIR